MRTSDASRGSGELTRPVVFVSFSGRRPATALARAAVLAARSSAPLSVLLVAWDHALEASSGDRDGARDRDEAWYDAALPREVVRGYHHRVGHLVHEAIQHAQSCDARIVVLPAELARSGTCTAAIAASAGVPVLIAHEPTSGDAIVVATDLRDPRYPIVRQAADMIDHLETTLVGLHNIDDTVTQVELARRRAALAIALEPISVSHEMVIDHAHDPADAAVAAARERDADLIVVGVPRRDWFDLLLHPTVASRIVANAHRSVLLAPLGRPSPQAQR